MSFEQRDKIDPQDEMMKDLEGFVENNKISGSELRVAYLMALGLSPEEAGEQEVNQKVEELARDIVAKMDNGLALNRIVDLVKKVESSYDIIREFSDLVDSLELTDKEKKILHSIVEQKRSGKLTLLQSKDNTKMIGATIPELPDSVPKERLAVELIEHLAKFKGVKGLYLEFSN